AYDVPYKTSFSQMPQRNYNLRHSSFKFLPCFANRLKLGQSPYYLNIILSLHTYKLYFETPTNIVNIIQKEREPMPAF
ncbi:MAG: hypothetical protein IKL83_06390, partial [Muribaculaceae bacterium]|nr:hypothetical protein [Muribaculaceae bacterium]